MLLFRRRMSSRCFITASVTCWVISFWMSAGVAAQRLPLARIHWPSHMWPVMDTYFCTSYSLAMSMMASGFSWPSTTLVCSAV